MPRDMAGQSRAALENLKRGLRTVATFADIMRPRIVRVTDLTDQDALNRVWGEYFGDAKPTTTTVQVVRLTTDRTAWSRSMPLRLSIDYRWQNSHIETGRP